MPRPRLAVPAKPTPTKATPVRRVRVSAADAAAHAERASVERLVRLGRPLYCGGGRGRYVALSFDDGPGPYTVRLLNLLHSARAKATFFLVGNRIHYWPLLPGREATLAALGDHTWNHADLTRLSPLAVRQELTDARVAIERASHRPVLLFRPPYERHDAAIDRRVREAGMLEVLWSLDPGDYVRNRTPSRVASLIEAHLRPGAIVLLHDIKPTTVQVVRRLLPVLRRRRLVPVTIPQLVRLDPPSAAQVRLGLAGCSGPLDRRRGE